MCNSPLQGGEKKNSVKNWYLQKCGVFRISFFQMKWVLSVLKNRYKKIKKEELIKCLILDHILFFPNIKERQDYYLIFVLLLVGDSVVKNLPAVLEM